MNTNDKKIYINENNLSIYDGEDFTLYTEDEITTLVNSHMVGRSFKGLPNRTRSKVSKSLVCESLGYNIPRSFKKTVPRFPAQNLDTYVQKSNNLQVWNQEIDPTRRYLIIRVNDNDEVTGSKVITGEKLILLDTTGTLTQKYQARLTVNETACELISNKDTDHISNILQGNDIDLTNVSPIDQPTISNLYSINEIYDRLKNLIGRSIKHVGFDQERNRGAELHKLVCSELGYGEYKDNGQFPDVLNQLLEIKLQTSSTIDLGVAYPNSEIVLETKLNDTPIRHKDVRYGIFYGVVNNDEVTLTNFYLTNGEDFFNRFPQTQGNVVNQKIQIPLPKDFFYSSL